VRIEHVTVSAYRIPTDAPESDGTLEWDSTTLVVVHVDACGARGLGYTYADRATAVLIANKLASVLEGQDAGAINARWIDMTRSVRNLGRPGVVSMALSALDTALWDLKAKLLGVALVDLLGASRDAIAVYAAAASRATRWTGCASSSADGQPTACGA
jgi:L-alanine-DL-glutamate epimerase-like enolase superfamily enzyme